MPKTKATADDAVSAIERFRRSRRRFVAAFDELLRLAEAGNGAAGREIAHLVLRDSLGSDADV